MDAPILGATKQHHLTDAAAALNLDLTDGGPAAADPGSCVPTWLAPW
ncbi:hypothetical protein [Arthrobacter sp. PM3]|nr:hypothetical protein [Arthrobacter sp. PM3]